MAPRVKLSTLTQKQVYRYTFEMRNNVGTVLLHTLLINPEEINQDEPARSGVTQTLGGAFVTDFGSGLPTVDISGTTGYGTRTSAEGVERDGYEEFVRFRQDVYRNFISEPDPNLALYWYNWEDSEFYEIQPQQFRLQRNKGSGPLYRYSMRFTCLRKLTETKGRIVRDYLLTNPSTQDMAIKALIAVSNLGEFLQAVTGNAPIKNFASLPKDTPSFVKFPILRDEQIAINDLMAYMGKVNTALADYNEGRSENIKLNMADVNANITICRGVCERMGKATKIPQDFLAELRTVQTQLQNIGTLSNSNGFGKGLVTSEGSGT